MDKRAVILCEQCNKSLSVPTDRGTLRIRCPNCRAEFTWTPNLPPQPEPGRVKNAAGWPRGLKVAAAIGVLICVFALGRYFGDSKGSKEQFSSPSAPIQNKEQVPRGKVVEKTPDDLSPDPATQKTERPPRQISTPQWVRISYDDLIDKRIITHSGQTIGALLGRISGLNAPQPVEILPDLQPYLEPFSFICNEIVAVARPTEMTPYLNITADYPAGSRQPAWAAMFREGGYQLFVGNEKARLFLKGKNAAALYGQYYNVIRHSLRQALGMLGANKMTVEVYAFENDYASRTISLNLTPYVLEIDGNHLGSKLRPLPLADLATFFDQGITLEAAEIEGSGSFYLYGTSSAPPTIASRPQSLEDFAVVYRSMYHYGYNAPYISLDRHEDNRYAKVNFGGLLEDTRVGSVVLEADKPFKTMSTGLDPNTRAFIREKIRSAVPDFVTEDERGLREKEAGHIKIRYWFYPDQIRTVTDGRIGVVEHFQFMADAERMDVKTTLGRAQRETIDHLNLKFAEYAQALPTYRELSTVGRMMAIVTWLQQNNAKDLADLDALLSVELSPFETPKRTKKLLAVTAETSVGGSAEVKMERRRKVYHFDTVLESVNPSTEDTAILDLARRHFSKIKDSALVPSEVQNAEAKIRRIETRIKSLESRIDSERKVLDRSSESEVARFNAMVDEFNSLRSDYNDAVDSYNRSIGDRGVGIRTMVSVGGGINLRSKDFAKALHVPDSPLIQRIRSNPKILRSSPGGVGGMAASPAKPYPRPWTLVSEQSTNELTKRRWSNNSQGSMSIEASPKTGHSHYRVVTKGYYSETTVKPGRKEMVVATSGYPTEIVATGDFSQGGMIILRRGNKVEGAPPPRVTE